MLLNFTRSLYRSRHLLFISLLLNSFIFTNAQTTLTQWNFNSVFNIPANGNAPAPSAGIQSGTITLIGGVTATNSAGVNADPGNPNNGLNTADYPAQSTAPKSAGISINVNTTGYNTIHLKFYVRHSGSAAKKVVVQYFNGTTWQDVFTYLTANTNFSVEQNIDLSGLSVLNNTASAQLRLVTDYSAGSMYEGATGAYSTGGTIRYDLVTITGNTLTCIGPATIQAAGLRLLKTDATSAQLTLNRGNGGGCLVVCSQSDIPSLPVNNTVYNANPSFGNGAAVGNGFAVYNTQVNNPAIQYFNITNLTAGTKYYLAAYEYSAGGSCYLTPAFVDSFYCNSTVLYPGDVQFVGYDNNVNGKDFFVLTNLCSVKKGTAFKIINSRFEAGAPANERTNRWYAGGNVIHDNIESIELLYTANTPLDSGKVISFEFTAPTGTNVLENGVPSNNFTITSKNIATGFSMLSSSNADQFFLIQGSLRTYGILNTNQYSLLNGYVLHGITYTNPWVSIAQTPGTGAYRESRIPPDISGLNLFFTAGGFAYYNPSSPHAGSLNMLLSGINSNSANWTFGNSLTGNQVNTTVLGTVFIPNRLAAAGTWTGVANDNNWFNALNWEGLTVPDSLIDVIIPTAKISLINANAPFANLYNRVASTRALTILGGLPVGGTLTINGTGADKLIVYDSLLVDTTGRFSALRGIDTIVIRGNLQRRDGSQVQAFDSSFLFLEGNRMIKAIDIWLITGTIYSVRKLAVDNPPGVHLLNGGIETVEELRLSNGVLSVISNAAIYYLGQNCSIVSPTNVYGESNKGWEKSFIDGRVDIRTSNTASTLTAPVGNAAKNIFAPMVFETNTDPNAGSRTYSASYTSSSNPLAPPSNIATPPLDHVSELEYWTLNSPNPAAAKITLYYTPYSRVSGAGNTAQALSDLRIAQYWDSISSPVKWRLYGLGGTYTVSGDSNYGKISYDQFATDLRFSTQNFTLGTVSKFNTLPIQLITWKATPQSKRVQLNWQVADESGVTFYNIEKSLNGLQYAPLQTVYKTSGGSNFPYTIYDDKPMDGWNYYRLKATGSDGKTFYSGIQKVWYTSAVQWSVYPNPATDVLWMQLPAAGTVTLYTIDGKIMLQHKLPASLNKLNIKSFAKGMYVLEYFDGRKRMSEKINLQ